MLSAVVMKWILALEANCNQTRSYMEIYNIINYKKISSDSCNFLQIFSSLMLGPRAVRERVK